jgi:tetratricopeptide (TPR) repeat protein
LIGALAIVAAVAIGIYAFMERGSDINVIKSTDPKLTQSEKETTNQRLTSFQEQLDKASTTEDKFKANMSIAAEYRLLGEYQKSKDALLASSKLIPDNVTPYNDLYQLADLMHDKDSAVKYLNKLIEINPTNKAVYESEIKRIQEQTY